MTRTFMGWSAVLATVLLSVPALAEDVTFASHSELMAQLERQDTRLAELEATLPHGGCTSCCADSCCDGCCDPCRRASGIIAGAELTFLKPHSTTGIQGLAQDLEFGYELAPRFWAGYQGCDGLGWRIRYWEFDHQQSATVGPPTFPITDSINYETYVIDLEFVDSMCLGCYWDATFFAGFRYLEFSQQRLQALVLGGVPVAVDGNQFENSSIGLTVGGELRRSIGCGLAAFGNVRASVLMGDEDETAAVLGGWVPVDRELDNIYYIWEAQLGAQWTRPLPTCGCWFVRAALEAQIWDNFTPGRDVINEDFCDWGLGGFAFSAGIIR